MAVRYDKDGDQHYDVVSAFIKSIRGSDVDAALHYLARMFEAGEDPRFIARRLVISASEDIGKADPTALPIAVAAAAGRAAHRHARGPGSCSPRPWSTSRWRRSRTPSYLAIGAAAGRRPRRAGRAGAACTCATPTTRARRGTATGRATGTRTTTRGGVVEQQYAPDALADRTYYTPSDRGFERELGRGWPAARAPARPLAGAPRRADAVRRGAAD